MKCQILFSGKNKNIAKCSLKIFLRVLRVKSFWDLNWPYCGNDLAITALLEQCK